ncbi:MAG: NAD(+)/NADH kinase [Oscillospiraceae bacterium]|nr:NAD(+)/NADH kinase [Oscillospiraceae bacterium]
MMLRFAIYPNFQKKNAFPCALAVCRKLHESGGMIYMDESYRTEFSEYHYIQYGVFASLVHEVDIVIAIGGDGTILRCARQMIGSDAKLLGINTGHLGFMATLETDQLDELGKIFQGEYNCSERMFLRGILQGEYQGEHQKLKFIALNDIVVSAFYGKVFDFSVFADHALIGQYRADGVICSTPTGSTAYALSAGGFLIEPEMSCMEVTLICPHSLFNRPMLLSPDRILTIQHMADCSRQIFLSADGEMPVAFPAGYSLEIRKSRHSIKLISMKNSSFFDAVNQKFMQSIKGFPGKE